MPESETTDIVPHLLVLLPRIVKLETQMETICGEFTRMRNAVELLRTDMTRLLVYASIGTVVLNAVVVAIVVAAMSLVLK